VSFHRRDLLKFMLFSGLAYSLPGFSALRRLEVADFKEKEGLLKYTLIIRKEPVEVGKRRGRGVLVNGLLPSPLLRFKEGKEVVINVINEMEERPPSIGTACMCPTTWTACRELSFRAFPQREDLPTGFRRCNLAPIGIIPIL